MTYETVWAQAMDAGEMAAMACTPTPMIVQGYEDQPVWDGVCGFASVRYKGNTGFGRWARKTGRAEKSYSGGLYTYVSGYGQSYERKKAFAQGFAAVLQANGVDAWVDARID